MKINIQIERLVLEGVKVAPHERPLLQEAVESELGRLLSRDGLNHDFYASGALPSLRVSSLQMTPSNKPEQFGHQIAQAVYSRIGQ